VPEQHKITSAADPVTDYLEHLLSARGEVQGQGVNWDDLLSDAVQRSRLQDAINASTLRPGFAPLRLAKPGEGNLAERRTQLLHIIHHVRSLPECKLKNYMLASAIPFVGEAILNE